ncbi:hypothetical protein DEHRE_14445 [Dehalobacter restrictus DSM 9455]|jgi:hypothetical protein|uniref:Uncharacterized protein n=1 Tax=Dehalobacter restrictus (strain DSM 9455 / PER-K23) TaxID=871738 RepID=A0ABN4C0Z6_DEHRP|nr:hypothetical protein DEHRE_14445 [Dehalobacter restrictus DSM 9455]
MLDMFILGLIISVLIPAVDFLGMNVVATVKRGG